MPNPGITHPATRHFFLNIFLTLLLATLASPLRARRIPSLLFRLRRSTGAAGQQNAQIDQQHRLTSTVDLVVLHVMVVDEKATVV